MDQPTIDGLNTYLVSRAAAMQGLKVALSGFGGDELFGGYPSFRQIPKLLKWGQRISFSKPFGVAVQALFGRCRCRAFRPRLLGCCRIPVTSPVPICCDARFYLEDELDALLDESWLKEGLERLSTVRMLAETVSALRTAGVLRYAQVAALESCWYMRNQLLRDTDWSSMAHGLEVRVPFVDICLLERLGQPLLSGAPPNKQDLAAVRRRVAAIDANATQDRIHHTGAGVGQ